MHRGHPTTIALTAAALLALTAPAAIAAPAVPTGAASARAVPGRTLVLGDDHGCGDTSRPAARSARPPGHPRGGSQSLTVVCGDGGATRARVLVLPGPARPVPSGGVRAGAGGSVREYPAGDGTLLFAIAGCGALLAWWRRPTDGKAPPPPALPPRQGR